MALITLEEAKQYLRVDSSDEDALIGILLATAKRLCVDVARIDEERWSEIEGADDAEVPSSYTDEELMQIREVSKTAILYALGYLYEHREEADHHSLTLTLRSLLFAIREGVF